jgi:hypothetical protein
MYKYIVLVECEGKKTALLQTWIVGAVAKFANVLFCAGAVCLEYCPKHQLPLRAKAGGENKFYQVRSICHKSV